MKSSCYARLYLQLTYQLPIEKHPTHTFLCTWENKRFTAQKQFIERKSGSLLYGCANHRNSILSQLLAPIRLNPIWTVDNGSLFIMSTTAEEFFSYDSGLSFVIKDYDNLGSNEVIARLAVSQTDLLSMKGERKAFSLEVRSGENFKMATEFFGPKFYLRVRPAQKADRDFMKKFHAVKQSKKLGIYADESFVAPKRERVGLLRKEKKVVDGIAMVSTVEFVDVFRPTCAKRIGWELISIVSRETKT